MKKKETLRPPGFAIACPGGCVILEISFFRPPRVDLVQTGGLLLEGGALRRPLMRTISPTGGRGDAAVVIGATACGLNSSIGRFGKGRFAFLRDRRKAGLEV